MAHYHTADAVRTTKLQEFADAGLIPGKQFSARGKNAQPTYESFDQTTVLQAEKDMRREQSGGAAEGGGRASPQPQPAGVYQNVELKPAASGMPDLLDDPGGGVYQNSKGAAPPTAMYENGAVDDRMYQNVSDGGSGPSEARGAGAGAGKGAVQAYREMSRAQAEIKLFLGDVGVGKYLVRMSGGKTVLSAVIDPPSRRMGHFQISVGGSRTFLLCDSGAELKAQGTAGQRCTTVAQLIDYFKTSATELGVKLSFEAAVTSEASSTGAADEDEEIDL